MVLWIGYLQWHFRNPWRYFNPPEPVLRDFHNIEHRCANTYDAVDLVTDESGAAYLLGRHHYQDQPGLPASTCDARCADRAAFYRNPRKAEWPRADLSSATRRLLATRLREGALGEGCVDALRATWKELPDSVDL
jgi:hypothetical protein